MSRLGSLSVPDKLLLAAYALELDGNTPFTAEDLVVSAWRRYRDTFGLGGHNDETGMPAYPDSNRVFAEIMGTKPIRKRCLLRKVGTKMYQLTEAGRDQARLLASLTEVSSTRKVSLARDLKSELRNLMDSRAVGKYRGQRQQDITFSDACAFWGISPRSSAIELQGRIANLERIVQRAMESVSAGEASFEHGGPTFIRGDVEVLLSVHRILLDRFRNDLEIIRRRTDER